MFENEEMYSRDKTSSRLSDNRVLDVFGLLRPQQDTQIGQANGRSEHLSEKWKIN